SVPANVLGQLVEIRRPVDASRFDVRWGGQVVATHTLAPPGTREVWDPAHRRAAEDAALGRSPRHLHLVTPPDQAPAERLDLGAGDYDLAVPDLAERYRLDGDA